MCGVDFDQTTPRFPGGRECCAGAGDPALDCDQIMYPQGPAFDDIVDFSRDEALWLRAYAKAWWIATENGQLDELRFLDPTLGPIRNGLSTEQAQECLTEDGACDAYDADSSADPPCWRISAAAKFHEFRQAAPAQCMNRHRTVAEQRPNRLALW